MTTTLAPSARPRGRPREARCDAAILTATLDMLIEGGAANLSIDGVAQRAGVGKATIYRRWVSKEALVLDAISSDTATIDIPETGTLRGDLEAYFDVLIKRFRAGKGADVLPVLIEAAFRDGVIRASLDVYITSRQQPVRLALQRAKARGELDSAADVDVLTDAILGPVNYRRLITGGSIDHAFVAKLLDIVLVPRDHRKRTT